MMPSHRYSARHARSVPTRRRRVIAGLTVVGTTLALIAAPITPASAAGTGVLSLAMKPVDSVSGAAQSTAQIGTHQNSVAYNFQYSCATADCTNTTISITPPAAPPDPDNVIPTPSTAPTRILSYSTWTPPFTGATIDSTNSDSAGLTVSLGTLAAGTSASFTIVYTIPNRVHVGVGAYVSPAQFYPDGFQIDMGATMSSATATAPVTVTAAPVTWHSATPAPSITVSNPGNVKPDTTVSYTVAMGTGTFTNPISGNIEGDASNVAATNYTVTYQLSPEVSHNPADVNVTLSSGAPDPLNPTYDPATNTITWTLGSPTAPDYNAAGGWGTAAGGNWNHRAPDYTPRTVTVTYPGTSFPDADASGCNFSDNVTGTVSVTADYVGGGGPKTASASVTNNVQCYTAFEQADGNKLALSDPTNTELANATDWAAPDTSAMTCPASGRDDWGRTCTPGGTVAPLTTRTRGWYVQAFNEANVPAVAVVTDNDLDQTGAHVTRISASGGDATMASVTYTLNTGTTGTFTGATFTAPAGTWVTKATVTSNPIPAAVNASANPNDLKSTFVAAFTYTVTPGTPNGTLDTNTASIVMQYPGDPSDPNDPPQPDINVGAVTAKVTIVDEPFQPIFQAAQTAAPVVAGGGTPVPGTNVTFSMNGQARTGINGSTSMIVGGMPDGEEITPEYVFFAPPGWTIPQDTPPTFSGTVPDGVTFTYGTATVAGDSRQYVVASWPNGVTFGDTGTAVPTMNVIAQPTAAAGGTSGSALLWFGDSRNQFTSTTANYAGATVNSPAIPNVNDPSGPTSQWFATATSTAVSVSGVAGLSVVKSICQPDSAQPDGCDWISTPGSVVPVPATATDIQYQVTLTNTGSAPITNLAAYDVLPYVGDTGTSQATSTTPRGSTFSETLTGVSDVSPAVTLAYSTSTNPCRPQVYPGAPGCADNWNSTLVGASAIRATVATLASGASVTFTYTAGVAAGTLANALGCNSVAVASDQTIAAEPQPVCASTEAADLAISAPDHLPLQVGRPGSVDFTVVNHGGSTQSPATVTVDVPTGLSVTNLSPAGYACSDTAGDTAPIAGPVTLSCVAQNPDGSARTLTLDTPETLSLPVTVDASAASPSCVDESVTGPLPDADPTNNAAESCFTVADAPSANPIVTKSDGIAAVTVGDQTTYTITVANALVGETLSAPVLSDTLPAGEQFVSATDGGTASGQTITWNLPDLGPAGAPSPDGDDLDGGTGSSVSVTVTVTILDTALSTVDNLATATATDPADPTATLTGSAEDTDTVTNVFTDKNPSITTPQNQPITTDLDDIVTTQGAPIDPTTVTQATAPAHGAISIDTTTGAVTYTPTPGYSGPDSYQIQVCDTSGPAQCHTSTVQVTVGLNVVTANDDTDTTDAGVAVSTNVRANDTSQTGTPLANPTVTTNPAHGTASVNAATGSITYTPADGFSGTDSYGYTVCDTSFPTPVCDTATVTITVTNVFTNGPAAQGNTGIVTPQNTPITTPLNQIVTATGSPVDPTTVTQDTPPTHGQITIDPTTGAVTYTPTPGYTGPDSYAVTVCDTSTPTPQCHTTTVAVTVSPNTVVVQDQSVSTKINTPTTPIDVLTSTTSASGQPLNTPSITSNPAHGSVTVNPDGTLTYTPDSGYQGEDSFTFTVCDTGSPIQACDTGTVTVTVTPVADLSTTKTLHTATVVAGLPISYTVTVHNLGPSAATSVHSIDPVSKLITDATGTADSSVPGGSCQTRSTTTADLARLDPTGGPYSIADYPQVVDCSYPSIPSGASVHDTISGTVDPSALPGGKIANQAPVFADTYDPDLTNNDGSATGTITASADLAVTKTAKTNAVAVGDQDTFTITVTNHGPSDATGITVNDTPTGMAFVSANPSQGTFAAHSGMWTIGTLTNGQTVIMTVVEKITVVSAKNTASISHTDISDPDPANNSSTAAVSVTAPSTPPSTTGNGGGTPLASTGNDTQLQLILVGLLLGAGGTLLLAARRRRRRI
jgi:uncharacterized repeat protein (TIGR01451 family)/LPXTG-motif cell wall-anchored protein